MKKKLLTFVLTGALSLSVLGGCGSDKDKAAEATPTQAATPTEAPQENNDEEEVSGDIEDFEAPVDDEEQDPGESEEFDVVSASIEVPEGLVSLSDLAGSWVREDDPNDTLDIVPYDDDPYSGSFVHNDAEGTTQIGEITLSAEENPDGSMVYWYYFYLDADEIWDGYCIPDQAEDRLAMGQGGSPVYVRAQ
ncbi:MAG: hypothetical protein K5697_00210 [Lachnospiraceae bacterium]|nr:hypothetical protein [Lachnospiraceae bacterium]